MPASNADFIIAAYKGIGNVGSGGILHVIEHPSCNDSVEQSHQHVHIAVGGSHQQRCNVLLAGKSSKMSIMTSSNRQMFCPQKRQEGWSIANFTAVI